VGTFGAADVAAGESLAVGLDEKAADAGSIEEGGAVGSGVVAEGVRMVHQMARAERQRAIAIIATAAGDLADGRGAEVETTPAGVVMGGPAEMAA